MAHILIVDDDPDFCYALERTVRRIGHTSQSCSTIEQCRNILTSEKIDAVFLDVMLPDGNGLNILPELNSHFSHPETIIITGAGDSEGAEMAITNGAWDYINKGTSVKKITLILKRALQYRTEKLQAIEKTAKVALKRDIIVGSSPSITACFDQVAQCATSDVNVIITGETGTGKELFARVIHDNSARATGPFVVVDCASLSETLTEAILFGHQKGAFTGADSNRTGLVTESNKGTLFLDEIGELPLSTQKSFLRVLQERSVRPVGAREEISCDFRLVAATHRHLEEMVSDGSFRSDLYFRLQSYHLHLPPLHQRQSDIDAIATFHINKICQRLGLERKGISNSCFEGLTEYAWPGNVRELVNCLEQTIISAGAEPTLYPKHLPINLRIQAKQASLKEQKGQAGREAVWQAQKTQTTEIPQLIEQAQKTQGEQEFKVQTLQEYRNGVYSKAEEAYLKELLAHCKGSLSDAIQISGLSQSRLYALLKNYGIRPASFKR